MADNSVIQQSPRLMSGDTSTLISNPQLLRISTLESTDNKDIIDNSYLLLANSNEKKNYKLLIKSLLDKINDQYEEKSNQLLETFEHILEDNYYTIDEINANVDNKHQLLYTLINELETEIDEHKEFIIDEYYNRDQIRALINGLRTELITKETAINNVLNNITDELTNNTNTMFNNSRLDRVEKILQYVANNIDTIAKIIWKNYKIDGTTESNPTYIVDNLPVTFTINKGVVMAKYIDETPDEDITNSVQFVTSTGTLNDNTITLNTNCAEGQQKITVQYKDHITETNTGEEAKIEFIVKKPKYNYYFWIVDSVNLSKIFNGESFNNSFYTYACEHSTGCPMSVSKTYVTLNLILEKFYSGNSSNFINNSVYIILPTQFINTSEFPLIKINGNYLKTTFKFEVISLDGTFTINESSTNVSEYSKQIEYSIIKIADKANDGQKLNIAKD